MRTITSGLLDITEIESAENYINKALFKFTKLLRRITRNMWYLQQAPKKGAKS